MFTAISQLIQYFACLYIRIISYRCLNANTCEVEKTHDFSQIKLMNFGFSRTEPFFVDRKLEQWPKPQWPSFYRKFGYQIIIDYINHMDYNKYVCMSVFVYIYIYVFVYNRYVCIYMCYINMRPRMVCVWTPLNQYLEPRPGHGGAR